MLATAPIILIALIWKPAYLLLDLIPWKRSQGSDIRPLNMTSHSYSSRESDFQEKETSLPSLFAILETNLQDVEGSGEVNFQRIQSIMTQSGKDRADRDLEKPNKSSK